MQSTNYTGVLGNSIEGSEITDGTITASDLDTAFGKLEYVDAGVVSTTSTSEVELDTTTIAAGNNSTDKYILVIQWRNESSNSTVKPRINDGTNDHDLMTNGACSGGTLIYVIGQNPQTNTKTMVAQLDWQNATTLAGSGEQDGSAMVADWMTLEHTISIRGNTSASGTLNVDWTLYKMVVA